MADNNVVEPKEGWDKSNAKRLLCKALVDGRIPLVARQDGKTTMKLKDIYNMHIEYSQWDYKKFSACLSKLRKDVQMGQDCA